MKKMLQLALRLSMSVFLIAASINSYSQGVTTAAIRGVITGDDGVGLPGATVIATHLPSGTVYGASTRNDGKYNLPNLRVGGPYEIKVSFIGFAEQKEEGVQLSLGQN